jgi:hypothetical protein
MPSAANTQNSVVRILDLPIGLALRTARCTKRA